MPKIREKVVLQSGRNGLSEYTYDMKAEPIVAVFYF